MEAALALRDRQLEELTRRVGLYADAVGLRNYTFSLVWGPLPEGEIARCSCVGGRAFAEITVGDAFFALDPGEQRAALLHEVLHPILDPLYRHIADLREELGRRHYEPLERVFRRDLERATDTLASAFDAILDT